jgi:hypothetical protein
VRDLGVSFYEARDGVTLQTNVAHVFNERGEGIVLRGMDENDTAQESYAQNM